MIGTCFFVKKNIKDEPNSPILFISSAFGSSGIELYPLGILVLIIVLTRGQERAAGEAQLNCACKPPP
jgi:hypothetical protein